MTIYKLEKPVRSIDVDAAKEVEYTAIRMKDVDNFSDHAKCQGVAACILKLMASMQSSFINSQEQPTNTKKEKEETGVYVAAVMLCEEKQLNELNLMFQMLIDKKYIEYYDSKKEKAFGIIYDDISFKEIPKIAAAYLDAFFSIED